MKKNTLLKSIIVLIVAMMLPQWAWATIETYDFTKISSSGDKAVNVDKNNPVTIDGQTLYMPTADSYNLEGRFAFQQIYAGSGAYREWLIRQKSKGLFAQAPQNDNTHFAILNILKDDKITITSSTASNLFFAGNPILKDVNADDVVESGKVYTATANGSILINIRNARKVNIVIEKITIESNNETVNPPTFSITKVNGIDREITITGGSSSIDNTTKTYYTTDNSNPTEESAEYTSALTFSENTTLKAITISSSGIKSTIATTEIEAGTTIKLEAPVFTKTAWSNGKATFSFNNKSSVLLNPTVSLKCTSGEADNISSNTVTLQSGTYSFHTEAEGYENSDDVILNVIADRQLTLAETLDFTSICNSYNAEVSLNSTSEYNDGKRDYYSFSYSNPYDETKKEERLYSWMVLNARKDYGLQNQKAGDRYVALNNVKKGQLIKIYGRSGGYGTTLEPTETDKAIVPNETTASVSAIEAIQDGTIAFSIPRLYSIQKIEIYYINAEVLSENVIVDKDATKFPNEKEKNAGSVSVLSPITNTGNEYYVGNTVTIVATPYYGYQVAGYRVKGEDTNLTTKEYTDATTGKTLLAADYTVTEISSTIEVLYKHMTLHKICVEPSDTALATVSLSPVYENFYKEVYATTKDGKQGKKIRVESWFTEGTEVTASADTENGYVVDCWTEKDSDDRLTESNSYTFTVGSADRNIIVRMKQSEIGSVIFDISNAHVNGESVASLHKGAISIAIDPIKNVRSFTIPTNYTFFKSVDDNDVNTANAYHLLYWIDKDDNDNRYELGKTYYFKKKLITLIPVFEANPTTRTNRVNDPLIRYDFVNKVYSYYDPTSKQQRNTYAPEVNIGNNTDTYWTAQAYFEVLNNGVVTPHTRDVTMYVNTGSKGYIKNSDFGDWCAFGPGTTFWCTSSVGTKVSILTYAKITTTTIDGVVPTLDETRTAEEREKAGSDHIYVYSYTTQNSDLTMPIVIGDDYSYYKWIEVSMRAANLVNLYVDVDNEQHGKVTKVESLSDFGATKLKDGGYSFRMGDRIRVSFDRLFSYQFDKIVDIDKTDADGNPFTLLKKNADSTVSMVDEDYIMHTVAQNEDGTWGTASGEGKTVFTLKATEPTEAEAKNGKRTSYEMEYDITNHRRIQFVFKEKPTYYIAYDPGKFAIGVTPTAEWVEEGDKFTIPKNQGLYYEGNTLKYWVDEDYDDNMTDEEKALHSYNLGQEYAAKAADMRLTPVFLPNSFNLLDLTEERSVTWPFARKNGAPNINYEASAGIYVSQLYNGSEWIDLKIGLDATDKYDESGNRMRGKFNNMSRDDRCQINKYSILTFPSTPNCVVSLSATSTPVTAVVGGKKDGDDDYKKDSKNKRIDVTCDGKTAIEAVDFTGGIYGKSFMITYKPQEVAKATLESLTCGDITLDAATIKQQMADNGHITLKISPWKNANEAIPEITGTVTEEGSMTVTTPTLTAPEAIVTVYTASGFIADTYPIKLEWNTPDDYPEFEQIVVNGQTYTGSTNEIDNVPRSGIISITFNRTMAETTIKMEQQKIDITASAGKTLSFKYWELPAGGTIQIVITPEQDVFKDIYGKTCQQTLSLTLNVIQDKEQYRHQAFDFIVGEDGNMDDAITAANNNKKQNSERFYIFVPNGEYKLTGNELVKGLGNINNGMTRISKPNISLIGQSQKGVTIYNEPQKGGISYAATIHLGGEATDFYAEDLTLDNRFDYWGKKGIEGEATQAAAFFDQGNRSIMKNVTLLSWQDTYYSNNHDTNYRGYFENCNIAGLVDFICGNGNIWFEKSNLILRKGVSNIVAPSTRAEQAWGYVFNDCNIKPEEQTTIKDYSWSLARPWQASPACTYLNTKLYVQPQQSGWKYMSANLVVRFHEYRSMNSDGILLSLGQRSLSVLSPAAGSDNCILKQAEAAQYTMRNVLGGNDTFEPNELCKQIDAVSAKDEDKDENNITWQDNLEIDDDILEWNAQKEALCYFIFKLDEQGNWIYKANTAENSIDLTEYGSGYYCVRAANQRGGLGAATKSIQYVMIDPYELEIKQLDDLTVDGVPYGWSTICLPFNAKVPEDVVVYAASVPQQQDIDEQSANDKITGYKMLLSPVEVIDSMKGYVVYGAAGIHYFKPTSRSCEHESILTGNPTDIAISTTNNSGYVLANKTWGLGFYRYTGQTYAPYRAWLSEDLVSNNVQQGLALGTRLIRFTFADETTHIHAPLYHKSSNNDDIYDLSGKKHKQPINKGIYIIPRKCKVLVK